jgi:hypothetical protein
MSFTHTEVNLPALPVDCQPGALAQMNGPAAAVNFLPVREAMTPRVQREYLVAVSAGAGKTSVPQVSKPAVSPISKSAGRRASAEFAGLETRDTVPMASGEVCSTGLPMKYPP